MKKSRINAKQQLSKMQCRALLASSPTQQVAHQTSSSSTFSSSPAAGFFLALPQNDDRRARETPGRVVSCWPRTVIPVVLSCGPHTAESEVAALGFSKGAVGLVFGHGGGDCVHLV